MTFRISPLARAVAGVVLGSSCWLPATAWAQGAQHTEGPYIGLYGGQSRVRLPVDAMLAQQLSGPTLPFTSVVTGRDERDIAYRVFAGYQLNRYLGLEFSYADLGQFSVSADTQPAGRLDGRIRVRTGGLDVVGTLPVTERMDFIWRLGAQHARVRGSYSGTGAVVPTQVDASPRGWGPRWGLGLQMALLPGMLLRAEADESRVPDTVNGHMRVRSYGLSLVWPLGRETGSRYAAPPAPAYTPTVAAAPMPVPPPRIVAVAPPPAPPLPAMRRVSFSAESLFGFDKATLRPEGQEALDRFAREAAGTEFSVMVVTGHTDRLGDAAYNQRLSLERADVVKAYLVQSGRFAPDKISAVGKGEDTPVTQPGDCRANLRTVALRACLQPDRRVDVELSGTR